MNLNFARRYFRNLAICAAIFFLSLSFSPKAFPVVGDEDIAPGRLLEIHNAHEELTSEERKRDEEEKRPYQIRLLEEKRKQIENGSKEDKELVAEIARLKSSVLVQKKRWKDRIQIAPREKIVFDSNILNQKKGKSDVILNSGTALELNLGTQKTKWQTVYDGAYVRYTHNSKLSRGEHRLGTSLRYPISSKTDMEASYHLTSTGNQNSEIHGVLKRLRQDAALTFNQRLSQKTGIRVSQTYSDVFFLEKASQNDSSSQYVISPELNYYISQKTSTFLRYALGFSAGGQNDSNEAVANEFRGGIRGKIAPKTTAVVDLGYSSQRLKKLGGSTNAFVAEVVVISDITRKSRIEFLINRSFSQAVQTEGSTFYVTENYRLTGRTQFQRFLSADLNAGVRRNLFDNSGRISSSSTRDLILELGGGMRYDFRKWLGFELRYVYSSASSTQADHEYGKQLVTFAVNGKY